MSVGWRVESEDGVLAGYFGDRDDAERYAEACTFRTDGWTVYRAVESGPIRECTNCGSVFCTDPWIEPEQAAWLGTDAPVWCSRACAADAGEQAEAGTPGERRTS